MASSKNRRHFTPSESDSALPGAVETALFGGDFIAFDDDLRTGDEIPGKRKFDQLDAPDVSKRQPKLARYEDGSFTTPWMKRMSSTPPKDAADFFNEEVRAYADYITPTHAENTLRRLIIQEIEFHARKIWSDATATAFGSYATNLYLPTGDIDIVINTAYASTTTKATAQNALKKLAGVIRDAGLAERRRVQVIAARVPIVKFNSAHAGIAIDICLNQTTGITAISTIKKHLEHFPALRPLILIVKSYLNQRGMNEVYKGGLGSYSIICMVISFLQMHPKIRLGEINPSENLGVLLVEFFELYGHYFNYSRVGISINRGGSYFLKMQRGWYDMSRPWLLSIVDPTDETNDVSRGSFQMLRLRQTLGGGALILTTRLLELSEQLRSTQGGYFFSLKEQTPLQTVLGKLVGVSPAASVQRGEIVKAYHSGRLHRALGLPPPEALESDGGESDMSLSDRGLLIDAKASRLDTHGLSAEEDADDLFDEDLSDRDNEGDQQESRYAARGGPSTSRRLANRFESLTEKKVEYVMSESDESGVSVGTRSSDGLARHANKRRRLEDDGRRPSQTRRASKRSYWASKAKGE